MLVDQIISLTWRLRRARTAESGEIALSVDAGWWKRSRVNPQLQWAQWEVWGDPVWAMKESTGEIPFWPAGYQMCASRWNRTVN